MTNRSHCWAVFFLPESCIVVSMDGEKSVRETLEELKVLSTPEEPYTGEIRVAQTELDKLILELIHTHGNDNIPTHDPYEAPHQRRAPLSPSSMTQDSQHRYLLGVDWMTAHIDITNTVKVLAIYDKKERFATFAPQLVIDVLSSEGGIASRTEFHSGRNNPDIIFKTHITDFESGGRFAEIFHGSDFVRELSEEEERALYRILKDPTGEDAARNINWLTSVSESEQQLTEDNRIEREKEQEEHEARLKSVVDAQRRAQQNLNDVIVG